MRRYDYLDGWLVLGVLPFFVALTMMLAVASNNGGIGRIIDNTGLHQARLAEARAQEVEARASEARARALSRWADNMPVIILFGGVAASIGLWTLFNGRVAVEKVRANRDVKVAQIGQQQAPTQVTQNLHVNMLHGDAMKMLQGYARQNNKRIATRGSEFFLVDNQTGQVQRVRPKQLTG